MQAQRGHRKAMNIAGHAHELIFSCYHGYKFLARQRTCAWLADAINQARQTLDFAVWAYVFMPEHVYLIVYPQRGDYDISAILRQIKQPVARRAVQYLRRCAPHWLPRITRRRGNRTERVFWQSGGGYDRNIDHPDTVFAMIEYIHANPVRRGLVARAIDWPWSSARWYAGFEHGPIRIDPLQ